MKLYSYKIAYDVNIGTESEPVYKTFYTPKTTTDEKIAKRESYNGKYEPIDDGKSEAYTPTLEERQAATEAALLELAEVIYGG